jgi:uncharacterized protein YuzE
VRITNDPVADAAYLYLTDEELSPGRQSIQAATPPGVGAFIVLDWKDGRLIGIEILDARSTLHQDSVRVTYDPVADAAYLYLTDEELSPGRQSIQAATPPGVGAFIVLDWNDGRLIGIEILDARSTLHQDLLDQAEVID